MAAFRRPFQDWSAGMRRLMHPDLDHEAMDGAIRSNSAIRNGRVVDQPEAFGLANGKTGLRGEAGPEAILPLQNGGVRAVGPDGRESALPLKRMDGGALGVQLPKWRPAILDAPVLPFAKGGIISGGTVFEPVGADRVATARQSPAVGIAAAVADAIGRMPAPQVNFKVENRAADAVQVGQSTRQEGSSTMFDVVIERIKGAIMEDVARGGMVSEALQGAYGLQRQVR